MTFLICRVLQTMSLFFNCRDLQVFQWHKEDKGLPKGKDRPNSIGFVLTHNILPVSLDINRKRCIYVVQKYFCVLDSLL